MRQIMASMSMLCRNYGYCSEKKLLTKQDCGPAAFKAQFFIEQTFKDSVSLMLINFFISTSEVLLMGT